MWEDLFQVVSGSCIFVTEMMSLRSSPAHPPFHGDVVSSLGHKITPSSMFASHFFCFSSSLLFALVESIISSLSGSWLLLWLSVLFYSHIINWYCYKMGSIFSFTRQHISALKFWVSDRKFLILFRWKGSVPKYKSWGTHNVRRDSW